MSKCKLGNKTGSQLAIRNTVIPRKVLNTMMARSLFSDVMPDVWVVFCNAKSCKQVVTKQTSFPP